MKRIHFVDSYLLNPMHPITVNLIGVGGTGSQVLTSLARIHEGLKALNHPGLLVFAYDPDEVSEANIGRQLFSATDIGLNKAVVHVTRINRFFGTNWKGVASRFSSQHKTANIFISCVDSAKERLLLSDMISGSGNRRNHPTEEMKYWIDFGNSKTTGQVILGTKSEIPQPKSNHETVGKLPVVTDLFNFSKIKEKDQGPSCSLAQALSRQDMFINSTLANLGCNLLWKLFTNAQLEHHGVYLNLDTLKTNPIRI